ncbi:LOW QUALITY PROTEIN: hypothetical protein J3E72DRAFT_393713 [Bipolaris maydis]|nr:LOW QUALITY PROTEIN: hypothetical protein J3E72DRAFT_399639 [Bipolaris maydis]KAJ6198866.1 LOW QUALITY PROTEIN: hypothetical protein J3E72DRAFT_393713 [Bipolaris maydis]
MAPSGTSMFAKFRPGHAKRNASSVAPPEQAVSSPTPYPLPGPASQSTEYLSLQTASSPLPPIARVASKLDNSHYTPSQHSATTTDGSPSNVMAHDPTMLSPPQRSHDFPSPVHEQKPLSARSNTATSPLASLHSLHYSMFSKSQPSLLSGISDKLTGSSKSTSIPTLAPPPLPQKSRSRLNLRKPMSLLMRRKSAQTLDPLADESLRSPSNLPPMPDNYDPSIRGKIVHDFNAPRLNRNYSYNTSSEAADPPKIDREHTPVFREHFDDDTSYEQAENLANKDFLARNSVQFPPPEHSPLPPPMPPKTSPPAPPSSSPPSRPSFQGMDGVNSVLSPVQESEDPSDVSADKSTKATMPPTRSRATSVTDPSFQPDGLPARFTSRFSFQISGGTDSAQEKLLEERHKAKEAEKKQARTSTNSVEDEYDEYGMDDYDDMDGGFDEEIPMLDEFAGGLGNQTLDSSINGFDFSSLSIQQNMNNPMNFALGQMQMPGPMFQQNYMPAMTNLAGLIKLADALTQAAPASISNNLDLDDDIVFDDPDGPLFDRKVKLPAEGQSSTAQPRAYDVLDPETGYEADDDIVPQTLDKSAPSLAHKTSIAQQMAVPSFENLSAYHSALADAAVRAEAAGRFDRKTSVDAGQPSSEVEEPSVSQSRPSLVPDDGRFSVDTTSFPLDDDVYGMSSGFVDDYDYSDFDSALEDDPIIAAANAEALAYDDEGFYGQEFGFYASAVGESPSAWGGFFGPSGVGRTVSGRNAVREPNLTPITERSEYSTRNSFISLNQFRDGQQPIASPALAQLARMSPYGGFFGQEEEDMSLDSLMKLRKGAFGASASSLPGSVSNSPRTSSPMGMQFVPRATTPAGNRMMEHPSSPVENPYFSSNNLSGHQPHDDGDYEEGDSSLMDAVNGAHGSGSSSEDEAGGNGQMESPTLTSSDYNSLSSPTGHIIGNEAPVLPSISELYAQHNLSLAMSPISIPVTSPSHSSLPASPFPMALSSPFPPQPHTRPPNPPSINTSFSSPTAGTTSTPGAPRRQSVVLSPISTSSPITPNGSSSAGGWNRGHSRKGSTADSVTYVREHDEAGEGRWVLERRRTAESGELELIGRKIVEGGRI